VKLPEGVDFAILNSRIRSMIAHRLCQPGDPIP
jgi:hypothetical protein